MKKSSKEKRFGDFSLAELRDFEDNYFYLYLGGDFVAVEGSYTFTKKEVHQKYDEIFHELLDMATDNDSEHEREYALDLMSLMHIQRARLH